MDILSISKIGLGTVLGISLGVVLRFFLIRFLLVMGLPVAALFALDYFRVYKVDWLKMNSYWQRYIVPHILDVYSFFSNHVLAGLVPGIAVGLCLGFILTRKLV